MVGEADTVPETAIVCVAALVDVIEILPDVNDALAVVIRTYIVVVATEPEVGVNEIEAEYVVSSNEYSKFAYAATNKFAVKLEPDTVKV